MKNDKSLLNLEKKLENSSTQERILSKFKFKPNMDVSDIKGGSSNLGNLKEFLQNFKKSNDELLNDQNALKESNIEIHNDHSSKDKDKKYIQMNLGLGILEHKPENIEDKKEKDKNNLLTKIISIKNDNSSDDFTSPFFASELDQQILQFLIKNSKKPKRRRRIHLIKKWNKWFDKFTK